MKIKGEYVLREIAGDHILIPIGETAMEMNGLITVNDVGIFIWQELEKGTDEDQILQDILETYEVKEEEARKDLKSFLNKLEDSGMILR